MKGVFGYKMLVHRGKVAQLAVHVGKMPTRYSSWGQKVVSSYYYYFVFFWGGAVVPCEGISLEKDHPRKGKGSWCIHPLYLGALFSYMLDYL